MIFGEHDGCCDGVVRVLPSSMVDVVLQSLLVQMLWLCFPLKLHGVMVYRYGCIVDAE
jgi:hypothetical protein